MVEHDGDRQGAHVLKRKACRCLRRGATMAPIPAMTFHTVGRAVPIGTAIAALAGAVLSARNAQPDQTHATAMECQGALWKKAFDEATAAGLNPGAIVVEFTAAKAKREVTAGEMVLTGVEDYRPTTDVAAFPVRYACRVDRASGKVRDVTYVAIDGNGNDMARSPVQLVKEGRLLNACIDRLESGLADDVRKRGVSAPSASVEIGSADAEFVARGTTVDIQGRGRARYADGFDWQVLVFQCRYDQKKQQVTRETHALETPSPTGALPVASRNAIEACRVAAGSLVLADARQRGYRRLERVEIELPELADLTPRGNLLDVQGRGQFRLDPRHRQGRLRRRVRVRRAVAGYRDLRARLSAAGVDCRPCVRRSDGPPGWWPCWPSPGSG